MTIYVLGFRCRTYTHLMYRSCSDLLLVYDCGTAMLTRRGMRWGNYQAARWIISLRELVECHDANATYYSTTGKNIYILLRALHFQERTVMRVAVCSSVTGSTP